MMSRSSLTEKQMQNMSCENSNGGNGGSGNANLGKLNGSESTPPSSNNTLEINQKYGFITGKPRPSVRTSVDNSSLSTGRFR